MGFSGVGGCALRSAISFMYAFTSCASPTHGRGRRVLSARARAEPRLPGRRSRTSSFSHSVSCSRAMSSAWTVMLAMVHTSPEKLELSRRLTWARAGQRAAYPRRQPCRQGRPPRHGQRAPCLGILLRGQGGEVVDHDLLLLGFQIEIADFLRGLPRRPATASARTQRRAFLLASHPREDYGGHGRHVPARAGPGAPAPARRTFPAWAAAAAAACARARPNAPQCQQGPSAPAAPRPASGPRARASIPFECVAHVLANLTQLLNVVQARRPTRPAQRRRSQGQR